jgi:hypothetical protein
MNSLKPQQRSSRVSKRYGVPLNNNWIILEYQEIKRCLPHAEWPLLTDNSTSSRYPATSAVAVALALWYLCIVGIATAQQEPSLCPADWSTATLSTGRYWLAATSLMNHGLAVFAGGLSALGMFFVFRFEFAGARCVA